MYCDKCGTENRDGAEYCSNCGEKFPKNTSTNLQGSNNQAVTGMDYIEQFKAAVSERYEVIRELGRGGMAIVFLARDKRLERKVALKLLPQEIARDKTFSERFMREAKISAKLSHPNIIQIHDVDSRDGFTYHSMSYIEGFSLATIIKKKGPLSTKIIARVGIQIAFALQQAHEKGVIHRDIKPENILINKKRMPIVVDFGIAKAQTSSQLSQTGMFIGTPHYMSPEQIKGEEVDGRSDIYSMGGLLYEMSTGQTPFKGLDSSSLMYHQVHVTPKSPQLVNKNVPRVLSDIIMQCLEKNPGKRPQSASELSRKLHDSVLNEGKTAPKPAVTPDNSGPPDASDDTDGPHKTQVMDSPGPMEEVSGKPAQKKDDPGTLIIQKPTAEKKQSGKKKASEKKLVPLVLVALAVFGIVSLASLGIISIMKDTTPPPPLQARQQTPAAENKETQQTAETTEPPVQNAVEQERIPTAADNPPVERQRPAPPVPRTEPQIPREEPAQTAVRTAPVSAAPRPQTTVPAQSQTTQSQTRTLTETPSQSATQATSPPQTTQPSQSARPADTSPGNRQLAIREVPQPQTTPPEPAATPRTLSSAPSGLSIVWIPISAGTFEMGDSAGDLPKNMLATPVHRVTISAFEMSRDEITVAQYAAFIKDTGHAEPPDWSSQLVSSERPVINVSWYDASAFAKWMNARLPTEAEWEYGARGGKTGQKYPWGQQAETSLANFGNAWNDGEGWKMSLKAPGSYSQNDFGLNDISGNVWEWCSDIFGAYPEGLVINPVGSTSGNVRSMRGGAWNSTPMTIRVDVRAGNDPNYRGPQVGFRIAR